MGRRQRGDLRGALRAAAREGRQRASARATSTSSTPSPAPIPRIASPCASITESPWHALFAKTLFIDPTEDELARDGAGGARPARAVGRRPMPEEDGTRSGTFVVLHPSRTEVLIGGTYYAGEIKKSIFTRHERPAAARGRLPDALLGERRRRRSSVAVFFGLSGTGKTTLSADPGAAPDRRRRARLGRRRRLQLRGRLLREGDPALRRGRAARSTRRRARSGRCSRTSSWTSTACSTSTTTRRPRTRAPPTSSSRSRTRCRRSARATRARSSS